MRVQPLLSDRLLQRPRRAEAADEQALAAKFTDEALARFKDVFLRKADVLSRCRTTGTRFAFRYRNSVVYKSDLDDRSFQCTHAVRGFSEHHRSSKTRNQSRPFCQN